MGFGSGFLGGTFYFWNRWGFAFSFVQVIFFLFFIFIFCNCVMCLWGLIGGSTTSHFPLSAAGTHVPRRNADRGMCQNGLFPW